MSDSKITTTIVVPCYNEAARLDGPAFRAFVEQNTGIRFLFVNDGSNDDTLTVITALAESHPALDAHSMPQNSGKAEAVRAGLLTAIEAGAQWVGYFDADLATPLAAISQLRGVFDERPQMDIVMAARVKLLGRRIARNPARHYAGRAFATCASLLLDLPVYDTQCGAKVLRVNEALERALADRFESGWIFDVELLRRLQLVRAEIGMSDLADCTYEYALDEWEDIAGSKVKLSDFPVAFFRLGQILARYGR
ncbi:MAG: glycosyltransferase involved in cell wall biosynthesis [Bradymonadia bacterium]|jgi:glycosyltransferase involved in cell wall biosynthesis